ncbi:unnamed protein product [Bemisia tabaci]|uniref:Uncharacterized protein n=1 Tax=Bemisia tabaci TaxID=7038 RepID=A0A9N9ZZ42_BEMTA|nr:unnamed protein product [Bemisia tabaci]
MGCSGSSPLVPSHNAPTSNGMRGEPPGYDLHPPSSTNNNGFLNTAKSSWVGLGDNVEDTINQAAEGVKQTFTTKFHEAEEKLEDTVTALRKDIADAISGRKEELDDFQDRIKTDASGLDGEARDMIDSLNNTTESLNSPFAEKIKDEEKAPEDYMPRDEADETDMDESFQRGNDMGGEESGATTDEYGMSSPPDMQNEGDKKTESNDMY